MNVRPVGYIHTLRTRRMYAYTQMVAAYFGKCQMYDFKNYHNTVGMEITNTTKDLSR